MNLNPMLRIDRKIRRIMRVLRGNGIDEGILEEFLNSLLDAEDRDWDLVTDLEIIKIAAEWYENVSDAAILKKIQG